MVSHCIRPQDGQVRTTSQWRRRAELASRPRGENGRNTSSKHQSTTLSGPFAPPQPIGGVRPASVLQHPSFRLQPHRPRYRVFACPGRRGVYSHRLQVSMRRLVRPALAAPCSNRGGRALVMLAAPRRDTRLQDGEQIGATLGPFIKGRPRSRLHPTHRVQW